MKKLVFWSVSFKPGSDDIRSSKSVDIINYLIKGYKKFIF